MNNLTFFVSLELIRQFLQIIERRLKRLWITIKNQYQYRAEINFAIYKYKR